ncbi:cell wall metabolism sensor histidine kinase WalK [Salipaludibacillus agaradhaerens]|jgi:two-component system sensor histidine kinase VicK|uniref:histidine kinase n=1 Tax=Salipaludibacillus agaradhaerens TaxID=76935 RepID=A0A9Q4B669_SALAG|nr:cell wall metabolism sensor histidine kinase WalK [Salipaludibacillus agaradhaerens]UJW59556.1 cell wall metabolism sensor histidine kinase WalK [Bacillus sp. A116_S68]MCR6098855.1 cell wall metabolism sensor histidine kinase WalK [Salipaludibacillus agaradhaerens]MCR6108528.1 cell wall metabolism sensor histidine kinase WalK [Salipaludibacillus agaradhaerens]MCR6115862.1 cell wall metabolism sensor histidine kinase WalK [Salipaludibacillus agaradhaerens]MCR6120549.1 cell wall metabolism se
MDKIRFYKSIHLKIVIIYVLLILIAMQVISVYFTQQLEDYFESNFNEQLTERVELVAYNVQQEMLRDEDEEESSLNSRIDRLIREFSMDNTNVQVVDHNSVVIAANLDNAIYTGQRTTDHRVKRALVGFRAEPDVMRDSETGERMQVLALPVETEDQQILGAIYIEASMEEIYYQMQQINQILFTGTGLAMILTAALGIFLSRTITHPITDMRKQAKAMGEGVFSRKVKVYGDDEIGQLAVTFNELSGKLKMANATTEGERRKLSSVLTHMTDGVVATNKKGEIMLLNRRAEELLNKSQEDTMGSDIITILKLDHFMKLKDLYNMTDPILLDFDHQEEETIVEAHFSVIENDEGEENGLIAVLHDVTEQELIEQERKEFVANVSHELRTPLTSMKSYLEALADGAIEDPEVAPHFVQVTSTETERMIRLVNDLLQLSKMDSKDYQMNLARLNVTTFINQVIDRFDMSTKNQNIQFKRKLPDKSISVSGDRDKLTQLLDNILSNAIKYSPEGGTITCSLKPEKERVVISVKDEGVGIPKENVGHVFDRFYRVDKARSRNLGGTGLGLAIAKEIAVAHGGNIWVSSEWGKGTTFSFSLPYEEDVVNDYD